MKYYLVFEIQSCKLQNVAYNRLSRSLRGYSAEGFLEWKVNNTGF